MAGRQPECEGQGVGGGLMPGQEHGEGFIADLSFGKATLFIGGFKQHAEKVVAGGTGGAASADDAVDDFIEGGEGTAHAGDGADGQALQEAGTRKKSEWQIFVEGLHGVDEGLDTVVDVAAEQAMADDAQGETYHFCVQVDGPGGLLMVPCVGKLGGECDDSLAIAGDAGAVKSRLRETAMTEVEGVLAGKEAFTEDAAGTAQDDPTEVVRGVSNEDVGDVVGVIELELAKAIGSAEADHVTEASGVRAVEGGGIDGEE